jgi:hypothetical protein
MSDRIECLGGPHDGETVPDRGVFWRVVAVVDPFTGQITPAASPYTVSILDEEGVPVRPGSSGTYVQRGGVYQWEPDP